MREGCTGRLLLSTQIFGQPRCCCTACPSPMMPTWRLPLTMLRGRLVQTRLRVQVIHRGWLCHLSRESVQVPPKGDPVDGFSDSPAPFLFVVKKKKTFHHVINMVKSTVPTTCFFFFRDVRNCIDTHARSPQCDTSSPNYAFSAECSKAA